MEVATGLDNLFKEWQNCWNSTLALKTHTCRCYANLFLEYDPYVLIFVLCCCKMIRAPSQCPKRRLSVRSRKVSKPRDLYLELSDRSETWQALRQQCCRCACQISKRYDNLKYQSRGFETLRDLTKRRLFGYWDGAQCLTAVRDIACLWGALDVVAPWHTHEVHLLVG